MGKLRQGGEVGEAQGGTQATPSFLGRVHGECLVKKLLIGILCFSALFSVLYLMHRLNNTDKRSIMPPASSSSDTESSYEGRVIEVDIFNLTLDGIPVAEILDFNQETDWEALKSSLVERAPRLNEQLPYDFEVRPSKYPEALSARGDRISLGVSQDIDDEFDWDFAAILVMTTAFLEEDAFLADRAGYKNVSVPFLPTLEEAKDLAKDREGFSASDDILRFRDGEIQVKILFDEGVYSGVSFTRGW